MAEDRNFIYNSQFFVRQYGQLTDLHRLVLYRQDDLLKTLIESGEYDIDAKTGKHGYTALHLAIFRKHLYSVKLLINNGANTLITDNDGENAIHVALNGEPNDISRFFVAEVLPRLTLDHFLLLKNCLRESILDLVFKNYGFEDVKWIINKFKGNVNFFPLHVAVGQCNYKAVKYLLDDAWDVNGFNEEGNQPLKKCLGVTFNNNFLENGSKILTMLLEGGAKFPWNRRSNSYDETFLFDLIEESFYGKCCFDKFLKLLAITPKFQSPHSGWVCPEKTWYFYFPEIRKSDRGPRKFCIHIIDCWKHFVLIDAFVNKDMLTLPYFQDLKECIKTIPSSDWKNETVLELTRMKTIQLTSNLTVFDLLTKPYWKLAHYYRYQEIRTAVAEKLNGSDGSELSKLNYFMSLNLCHNAIVSRANLLKSLTESNIGQCLLEPIWEMILDYLSVEDISSFISALEQPWMYGKIF